MVCRLTLATDSQCKNWLYQDYCTPLLTESVGMFMADLSKLREIMRQLRDPEHGCPWDRKQTFNTIVPHTLEEAYEVADAIESHNFDALPSELGDLLFQVVFYSQLAEEEGRFSLDEVVGTIEQKLIKRHPHVFERTKAGHDDIERNWESLKASERRARDLHSELDDIALNLPALSRAAKVQKRAARVGFDWPDIDGPMAKISEELSELDAAVTTGGQREIDEELGDLLFAVVNLARHVQCEPEQSLRAAVAKFERRFRYIESAAGTAGKGVSDLSLAEMEKYWLAAKQSEKKKAGA